MHLLILANTALAGSPASLASAINKYTKHSAVSVLRSRFVNPEFKDLEWPYDMVAPSVEELAAEEEKADVILYNQRPMPLSSDKPKFILYHAQPNGYIPGQTNENLNGRKMVVAQYQAQFYTDAVPMPNIVDIWDEQLTPLSRKEWPVILYMGIASETASGWGRKGSEDVKVVFQQMKAIYPGRIETIFLKGRPVSEAYKAMRTADIVFDDIVTGSYHKTSIEGMSVGAAVFNNISSTCENTLKSVTGASDTPFIKTDASRLNPIIRKFMENKGSLRSVQKASRAWVEKYWDPRIHVKKYIEFIEGRI